RRLEPLLLLDQRRERRILAVGVAERLRDGRDGRPRADVDDTGRGVHLEAEAPVQAPARLVDREPALHDLLLARGDGDLNDEELVLREPAAVEAALGVLQLRTLCGEALGRDLHETLRLEQIEVGADDAHLFAEPRGPRPGPLAAVAGLRGHERAARLAPDVDRHRERAVQPALLVRADDDVRRGRAR